MFENIMSFFRKMIKKENKIQNSKEQAKERLHLVLMQDRANVSADFLDLMRQEIIDVIKKYIDVDESAIDVRLTNKDNGDGTTGAPALYANIPITKIKENLKLANQEEKKDQEKEPKKDNEKENQNVDQSKNKMKKEEKNDTENDENVNSDKIIPKNENENKDEKVEDKKEESEEVETVINENN